jgi:hypothetical protein
MEEVVRIFLSDMFQLKKDNFFEIKINSDNKYPNTMNHFENEVFYTSLKVFFRQKGSPKEGS